MWVVSLVITNTTYAVAQSHNEQNFREKNQLISETFNKTQSVKNYIDNFEDYLKEQKRSLEEFRNQQNAEFANFMKTTWEPFTAQPAIPAPQVPEPIKPVVKEPETKLSPQQEPLPVEKVIIPEEPQVTPEPFVRPLTEVPIKPEGFSFDYYGTICTVPLTKDLSYVLDGIREKNIARVWELLSQDKYLPVIKSCLYWRDELQLSDWGYYKFLEKMTFSFSGAGMQNEARVMQMFILTQSGYKVRIGRSGEKLFLLIPTDAIIYDYSYLVLNGIKFFIMDKQIKDNIYVLNHNYPQTLPFSIQIKQEPKLSLRKSEKHSYRSKRYPELMVELYSNLNLIDFYNECPLNSEWNYYVQSSLSLNLKNQIFPTIKESIERKSEIEVANILLNFVQTAFEYKTDENQFGYERPLYGDETFYYPFSDCEDRAILYAILMHDIKQFDVVLLHYEGHVATAVHFNEDVQGDYYLLENKKYVVCDPTYINSSVGESMPKYRKEKAEIIQIYH